MYMLFCFLFSDFYKLDVHENGEFSQASFKGIQLSIEHADLIQSLLVLNCYKKEVRFFSCMPMNRSNIKAVYAGDVDGDGASDFIIHSKYLGGMDVMSSIDIFIVIRIKSFGVFINQFSTYMGSIDSFVDVNKDGRLDFICDKVTRKEQSIELTRCVFTFKDYSVINVTSQIEAAKVLSCFPQMSGLSVKVGNTKKFEVSEPVSVGNSCVMMYFF
ncbi:MAG: hypothetical protein H6510_00395 [Acidobacteria bacterium]|nr:hypothetical protein [Acidobacteriota bacterium]MCB9396247.1 hypothetical protein [Acidobacteriota bacterium]